LNNSFVASKKKRFKTAIERKFTRLDDERKSDCDELFEIGFENLLDNGTQHTLLCQTLRW
jgi:hypothetical protein